MLIYLAMRFFPLKNKLKNLDPAYKMDLDFYFFFQVGQKETSNSQSNKTDLHIRARLFKASLA